MEDDLRIHGDYLDDLKSRARDARLNRFVARYAESLHRGRDYTNFILVAGYAAFFALWSDIAMDIGPIARCASAGFLGSSLLVFIGWEIAGMVLRTEAERPLSELSPDETYPGDFEDRWDAAIASARRMSKWYWKAWPPVLAFAATTGLSGGAILAGAAIARVFA